MREKMIEEVLLEHHKEYLNDKENLKYAKNGTEKLISDEEVEKIWGEDHKISSERGKMDWDRRISQNGIITLAERIKKTFIEEGKINLIGTTVSNIEELASILQIYKNPNYETFRIIYMKNNMIVGIQGITCKLPGISIVHEPEMTPKEYVDSIINKMDELEADGFYMTHNHPSGDVKPSLADIMTTHVYATGIPGFLGHIITDHTKFTFLTDDYEEILDIPEKYQINLFEQKKGQESLLDIKISSSEDIANIAKLLDTGIDTSLVIYVNVKGRIEKVEEVADGIIKSDYFKEHLRGQLVAKGLNDAFCLTESESVYYKFNELVAEKYIRDGILVYGPYYESTLENVKPIENIIIAGKSEDEIACFSYYDKTTSELDAREEIFKQKDSAIIKYISDRFINTGIIKTTTNNWTSKYEDVAEYIDYATYTHSLEKIREALYQRVEVEAVNLTDDEFDIIYKAEYCKNIINENNISFAGFGLSTGERQGEYKILSGELQQKDK